MFSWQLLMHIIILINVTLIGGILPLIERKYLSLIQRRVGPKFVGYKGRLQFIADALKMFLWISKLASHLAFFSFRLMRWDLQRPSWTSSQGLAITLPFPSSTRHRTSSTRAPLASPCSTT